MEEGATELAREREEIRTYVNGFTSFGHRGSATANEAQAAEWSVSKLADMGISAEVQPFRGRRSWAVSYLLHLALAAIGAILLLFAPWLSAVLIVVVIVSLIGEHTTKWPSLRQLLGTSPSQNVFAQVQTDGEVTQRFILIAHLDTQRTGLIWNERSQQILFTATWLPIWMRNAFFPVIACFGFEAISGVVLALGRGGHFAVLITGFLLIVYLFSIGMTANWWRSPYVPGGLDNASGVAAVMALASRFRTRPIPGVSLCLLITGCEESGLLGAAEWAKQHSHERRDATFINMDCVGVRPIRYFSQETPVIGPSIRYPQHLLFRAAGAASNLSSAPEPIALPGPTDGLALLAHGFEGITICGLTADGRMPNYHQMTDTAQNVDCDAVQEAVDFAWAIMRHQSSPARD